MKKRTGKIIIIAAVAAVVAVLATVIVTMLLKTTGAIPGAIIECSFDNGSEGFVGQGYTEGASDFSFEATGGVGGSGCLVVMSSSPNDARFQKPVSLKKNVIYKISCDVKVESIGGEHAFGANVSFLENFEKSGLPSVSITGEWQHIEYYAKCGSDKDTNIALRLGYYSSDTSGKVYFDNLKVETVKAVPDGASFMNIFPKSSSSSKPVTSGAEINENVFSDVRKTSLLLLLGTIVWFLICYAYARRYDGLYFGMEKLPQPCGKSFNLKNSIILLLVAGTILRLVLTVTYYQCDVDVGLFKYWGNVAASNFAGIYTQLGSNLDYPPLYLYPLALISLIKNLFPSSISGTVHVMLVKVPSIITDIVIGVIIYKMAMKKRTSPDWTMFFTAAWIFNPLILLDSACWGQVDSILTLLIIACAIFLNRKIYILAGIFLGLGIMLKPQMFIFAPVFFYMWLKDSVKGKNFLKGLKNMGMSLGGFLAGALLPCLPFLGMPKQEISILGKTITGPWILSLFLGTANHYSYATVNCYNFWFLLGKNWVKDDQSWGGLSIFTWGMLFIVITCLIAWAVQIWHKDEEYVPYMLGAFIYLGVSTFGPRMHERYFFPAVAMLLIAAILSNKKQLLGIFGILSAAGFISVSDIMMGLLAGASLKNAGAEYDVFAQYYWPSLTGFNGTLAALFILASLLLLAFMIYDTLPLKKRKVSIIYMPEALKTENKAVIADESSKTSPKGKKLAGKVGKKKK